MKIRVLNGCEYWYDTKYRVWYAARLDAQGNLGPAIDCYSKADVIDQINRNMV